MCLIRREWVEAGLVRSLIGCWLYGALLRRELMSIPHAIFKFVDVCDGKVVKWWNSARREFRTMAWSIPFMVGDLGVQLCPYVFATDARGGDNYGDCGAYGMVAAEISRELFRECLDKGQAIGRTIARLSGDLSGLRNPGKEIAATVPFSLLPNQLFDSAHTHWMPLASGKWKYLDHITLGECRTVVKLVQMITREPGSRRHLCLSLQDNQPTAFSLHKGRSPAPALNFLLRKKAGLCLLACVRLLLPWVESKKQPADEESRKL